jgi:hypothetical protein
MAEWVPNLSWIQPDLAVGGSFPAEHAATLGDQHGVGAIIDLRVEACDDIAVLGECGIRFLHLPTPDMAGVGQAMLELGVAFAAEMARQRRRLLVHCEHGIGRSATLALCILVDRGANPLSALQLAKDARALVSPSRSQYEAWAEWLRRRDPACTPPTYHEFGLIVYRHLARSA